MRYLIDTNWVIDVLRNAPGSRALVEERAADGIAISVVSIAELFVGPHRRRNPAPEQESISAYLSQFSQLPIDLTTCEIFGRIKAELLNQGNPIEDFDIMIAATALQHDLTLLTNNRRHFERIDGLQIESV